MKHIQNLLIIGFIFIFAGAAAAQTESDLKRFFEGRRVEVKIDMPATKDGIDVYTARSQPLDFSRYAAVLKANGIGVRDGERIMITKIKVKKMHVEFQLGGGGYGTMGDETDASVYVPSAEKTRREKNLERELKDETDDRRRRRLREELSDLRRERERENARNRAEAATAEELAKGRIAEKRLQGGSRFNIRFDRELTAQDLTPKAIMGALAEYVDFPDGR